MRALAEKSRPRVLGLHVHNGALGKAASDGVEEGLGIPPAFLGKGEGLAHGQQVDAHHHVVGHLGEALPQPEGPM